MTPERRELFLRVLSQTGVYAWAARAASPHANVRWGAANSFRDVEKRDPEFKAQVAAAMDEANGRVEHEAYRRAVEGVPEPVFQKGRPAVDADGKPAMVQRYSDRLLERLLESRMPDRWTPRKGVELSGSVAHSHSHAVLTLSVDDVLSLSEPDREALGRIVERIAVQRGEIEAPPIIDVTPVIEAAPVALPHCVAPEVAAAHPELAEIL